MCTLTYIPTGLNSFILTSNRDEHINRKPSSSLQVSEFKGEKLIYAKDLDAGGTWLASSEQGRLVCLLNGAFKKHQPKLKYKASRGLVTLDSFRFKDFKSFAQNYDFSGIAPFTMICLDFNPEREFYELKWDEEEVHFKSIDSAKPQIWSSVTLYNESMINERTTWFNDFVKDKKNHRPEKLWCFHTYGGHVDSENKIFMDRETHKTVSISQFAFEREELKAKHWNRLTNDMSEESLALYSFEEKGVLVNQMLIPLSLGEGSGVRSYDQL